MDRPSRSPLHARLRFETAALHRALEDRLDLLGPDLSVDRYRRVLRAFHGYHGPLEAALAGLAPAATPPLGFPLPEGTAALERDLLALGATPAELAGVPRCAALPRLNRAEHLAGVLYVVEGARLGGQVISPALERRLGLVRDGGAAFFAGAGEDTGPRWRAVLSWLDEVARGGADLDEVVAAAAETFATLATWATLQGATR